ncbi:hypothetical protein [Umezawaea sp. Da 62-37]|uniref:hypothetical protein n=1 Tax=Umezawaea sp. Da 62-37 TaxID=3075927 RepID=UPI0028F74C59|nr:hypothetical protein [Umezawaea sp. Da 62-37]WNV85152.1 hypothetical protein RM788_44635 [Umezawaea sp. Da 62-37]
MRSTLLRTPTAVFLIVAVADTLVGIGNHVNWPYVIAVLCVLVAGGLMSCGRVATAPKKAQLSSTGTFL